MQNLFTNYHNRASLLVAILTLACASAFGQGQTGQAESKPQDRTFRGGLGPVKDQELPRPIRNNVAQPGEEVVTLRYFKIKKGAFDQFLKASVEGVWPSHFPQRADGSGRAVLHAGIG
jgi:hypothetical protein